MKTFLSRASGQFFHRPCLLSCRRVVECVVLYKSKEPVTSALLLFQDVNQTYTGTKRYFDTKACCNCCGKGTTDGESRRQRIPRTRSPQNDVQLQHKLPIGVLGPFSNVCSIVGKLSTIASTRTRSWRSILRKEQVQQRCEANIVGFAI